MEKIDHILFIDDDAINNHLNKMLMEDLELSHKISFALNGKEGLDLLQSCLDNEMAIPELIFLDINMPVMDGFEFIHRFLELKDKEFERVQICMLTTSHSLEELERANSLKRVTCFTPKPLNEDQLKETWVKCFGQPF